MLQFAIAALWQAALLSAFAFVAQADDADTCISVVEHMFKSQPMDFAKFSLATGKSLPHDAGKYVMCMNQEHARYFLVKVHTASAEMEMADLTLKGQSHPMEIGFCVPDACDHAGIISLVQSDTVKKYIPSLGLMRLVDVNATSPQLDMKQDRLGGMVATTIVGSLVLLVLMSSAVVLAKESRPLELPRHEPSSSEQLAQEAAQQASQRASVFEAFSLFGKRGTLKPLMDIPTYKPTDCLNGLRVLAMFSIVLFHTFLEASDISGYANQENIVLSPLNSDTADRGPWLAVILSGVSAVDTFFFISGFLLSYLTLKELRGGKNKKILSAVMLRYLRLTPSLALTMLVYYKIVASLGYGPFAVRLQDSINSRCDGSWWSELTYTVNFLPFDADKVCMGWTWYLGNDMIFFIISLFILPIYHRRHWLGWLIILVLTGISFGVTTWLVIQYNLSIYAFDYHYTDYSYYAYSKPYTRIPAYFVGITAAWLLDELEQRGFTREARPHIAPLSAKVIAGFAGATLLFLVFITFTDGAYNKNSWGPLASVLYITLSRPVWAMCCATIALLCYYDCLPLINSFLAQRYWIPLGRLTYGAYLVHPVIIKLAAGRSLQYYTFNGFDLIYRFGGNCMMAYFGSFMLWILVERPCMTLSSRLVQKPGLKKTNGKDSVLRNDDNNSGVDVLNSPIMGLSAQKTIGPVAAA